MKRAPDEVTMLGIVVLILGVAVLVSWAVWFFSTELAH